MKKLYHGQSLAYPNEKVRIDELDHDSMAERLVWLVGLVHAYAKNALVRQYAIKILQEQGAASRDYPAQIDAIFSYVRDNMYYVWEKMETFQTPLYTLKHMAGDCLPVSTLVLRQDYQRVAIIDLKPGDQIASASGWTGVQEMWISGEKPILVFELNNGSVLRCSPEHRVFKDSGVEARAIDLKPGDLLLEPEKIPISEARTTWARDGAPMPETDFAWLLGVFIADGWSEERRFAISGLDGKPKEAQKERVKQILDARGIHSRWAKKYLSVNDSELTAVMAACGKTALHKHVPNFHFSEDGLRSMLSGLKADASYSNTGTVTHGTISKELALDLRVLYRMVGQSTHIRRVDKHGGFGSHPIYRITARTAKKALKILGVREEVPELCADLKTSGGNLWLPESDTIVHNCDDFSILLAALLESINIPTRLRIIGDDGDGRYAKEWNQHTLRKGVPDNVKWKHIFVRAGVPPKKPTQWLALETTVGGMDVGEEPFDYLGRMKNSM